MNALKVLAILVIAAFSIAAAEAGVVRYDCRTQEPNTPISGHVVVAIDFDKHTVTMANGSEVRSFDMVRIDPSDIGWTDHTGGYSIDRRNGVFSWAAPSVHTIFGVKGQCTVIETPAAQAAQEYYLCWGVSSGWPTFLLSVSITAQSGGAPGYVHVIGDPRVGGLQQPYSGPIQRINGAQIQWEFPAGSFWLDRKSLSVWGGVTRGERKSELAPMRCKRYSVIG